MAIEEFTRDLGYLDKFFEKLDAEAANLAAASAARLRALLGEERSRWAEIRTLLAGGAPAPASGEAVKSQPSASAPPSAELVHPYSKAYREAAASAKPAPAPESQPGSAGFTVGSLRRRG